MTRRRARAIARTAEDRNAGLAGSLWLLLGLGLIGGLLLSSPWVVF